MWLVSIIWLPAHPCALRLRLHLAAVPGADGADRPGSSLQAHSLPLRGCGVATHGSVIPGRTPHISQHTTDTQHTAHAAHTPPHSLVAAQSTKRGRVHKTGGVGADTEGQVRRCFSVEWCAVRSASRHVVMLWWRLRRVFDIPGGTLHD